MNILKLARRFELKLLFAQSALPGELTQIIDNMHKILQKELRGASDKRINPETEKMEKILFIPKISNFYDSILTDGITSIYKFDERVINLNSQIRECNLPQNSRRPEYKLKKVELLQEKKNYINSKIQELKEVLNNNDEIKKLQSIIDNVNFLFENKSSLSLDDIKSNFNDLSKLIKDFISSKGVEQRLKQDVSKYFDIVSIYSGIYTAMGAYGDDENYNALLSASLRNTINSITSALDGLAKEINKASKFFGEEVTEITETSGPIFLLPQEDHQKKAFMFNLGKYLGLKISDDFDEYVGRIGHEQVESLGESIGKLIHNICQAHKNTAFYMGGPLKKEPYLDLGEKRYIPPTQNIINTLKAIKESEAFQNNLKKIKKEEVRLSEVERGETESPLSGEKKDLPIPMGFGSSEELPAPKTRKDKLIEVQNKINNLQGSEKEIYDKFPRNIKLKISLLELDLDDAIYAIKEYLTEELKDIKELEEEEIKEVIEHKLT